MQSAASVPALMRPAPAPIEVPTDWTSSLPARGHPAAPWRSSSPAIQEGPAASLAGLCLSSKAASCAPAAPAASTEAEGDSANPWGAFSSAAVAPAATLWGAPLPAAAVAPAATSGAAPLVAAAVAPADPWAAWSSAAVAPAAVADAAAGPDPDDYAASKDAWKAEVGPRFKRGGQGGRFGWKDDRKSHFFHEAADRAAQKKWELWTQSGGQEWWGGSSSTWSDAEWDAWRAGGGGGTWSSSSSDTWT